jgi:carbamoyltransferase
MKILGFNSLDTGLIPGTHDSSAAIICDGRLVAAIEQERLSREKHDRAIPIQAIKECLSLAGLTMADIDLIAFPDKPYHSGTDSYAAEMDWAFIRRARQRRAIGYRTVIKKALMDAYFGLSLPNFNWHMAKGFRAGLAALTEEFSTLPPIRYVEHHRAHAAASYFSSPFEEAAVATVDANGGPFCTGLWSARGTHIKRLTIETAQNSLGFFYYDCTSYLGLGLNSEGKTMGLASYGDRNAFADKLHQIFKLTADDWYDYIGEPTLEKVGFPPRTGEDVTNAVYADFAAAAQQALELTMNRIARRAIQLASCRNLCLGGGVALNCSSNGVLSASGVADTVWVHSAPGDAGLSIGAAALCAAETGELKRETLATAYLGPGFTDAAVENALRQEPRLRYRRSDDIARDVSGLLAEGKIIGWHQGRMEFGPRALGARSILADPRTVEMRDRVNRVKRRELWRPLAPAVLAEKASEYFDIGHASPLMLFACPVRHEKRSIVPAVVHVDGTARPQTVTVEQNPPFHRLLAAFFERTGIPILLNTSFNDAGEPVVCTPRDAIRTYLNTDLDLLVCGNYIVERVTA